MRVSTPDQTTWSHKGLVVDKQAMVLEGSERE